jgi:hypothetical protein
VRAVSVEDVHVGLASLQSTITAGRKPATRASLISCPDRRITYGLFGERPVALADELHSGRSGHARAHLAVGVGKTGRWADLPVRRARKRLRSVCR